MSKKEPVFVPEEPTYRLEMESGTVLVKSILYGPITPERLEAETNMLKHRLEQLS